MQRDYIPGQYIATFSPGIDRERIAPLATELSERHELELLHIYDQLLFGFSFRSSEAAARDLESNDVVAALESDLIAKVTGSEARGPWGIDRVNEIEPRFDGTPASGNAPDIDVYFLDTGIFAGHVEFEDNAVSEGYSALADPSTEDLDGHGTHVAATIAGGTFGLARRARLHPVRVLNHLGQGVVSQVIDGLNWVARKLSRDCTAVVNMSLSAPASQGLNKAVDDLVTNQATPVVVSSGNDGADTSGSSPASAAQSIAVGACMAKRTFGVWRESLWAGSNHGPDTDLYAPGFSIESAWLPSMPGDNVNTAELTGTSMASAHCAGVVALARQAHPAATPSQLHSILMGEAISDKLVNLPFESVNKILGWKAT